jgi:hypothetical protein
MSSPLTFNDLTKYEQAIMRLSIGTFFTTAEIDAPEDEPERVAYFMKVYERYAETLELNRRMIKQRIDEKLERGIL